MVGSTFTCFSYRSMQIDPTGYWISEKLDGVRAYWSGSAFYSRQGNQFFAPPFFTKDLPKTVCPATTFVATVRATAPLQLFSVATYLSLRCFLWQPLDGELWCGRGLFSQTVSIIKKAKDWEKYADQWKFVTYLVFDAPSHPGKYEERVEWLKKNINKTSDASYAAVVGIQKCEGLKHMKKLLKEVLLKGGEGLMLRQAGSPYEHKRSNCLLKVKFFHDEGDAACAK